MEVGGPCDSTGCEGSAIVGLGELQLCLACFDLELGVIQTRIEKVLGTFRRSAEPGIRSPLLCGDPEDPS